MKEETIGKIRVGLKYLGWIIIICTIILIFYEKNVHGDKYIIKYNVTQATPYDDPQIVFDDCGCPEREAMNNLINFVNVLKFPFFLLVIVGLLMFMIDNPDIIKRLKNVGEEEDDNKKTQTK